MLRLMTFNLLYSGARNPAGPWSERKPLAFDLIRKWQPDVIGLQEVQSDQLAQLKEDLDEYGVIPGPLSGTTHLLRWCTVITPCLLILWLALTGVSSKKSEQARRNMLLRLVRAALLAGAAVPLIGIAGSRYVSGTSRELGEYCPILYRKRRIRLVETGSFWISEAPDRPGSVLWLTWLPRVVNWARFEAVGSMGSVGSVGSTGSVGSMGSRPLRFTVFNTHVDYVPWGSIRSGGVISKRMEMIWDGSPQFLIGDFNSSSGMPLYRDLMRRSAADQEQALHDAWLEAQQTSGPDLTFHGGAGEKRFPGRIDYIFYRPELTVLQAATLPDHRSGYHPSDHYPVIADFG